MDARQRRAGARGGHALHTEAALRPHCLSPDHAWHLEKRGDHNRHAIKEQLCPECARQAAGANWKVSRREAGRGAHTLKVSASSCS